MKVWLKYTGWYEESSVDSVLTKEAMLKDKQSYLLEAMTEFNNRVEHLENEIRIAKENRQPCIEQHKEYCQRKNDLMESLDSLATLSDDQQKRLYVLLKDVKAKLRKYTKEIERKSFYIKDLERKIEKLRNQTEEEILDSYLRENHIAYESWEVLEH